jgi:flagellar basal-body rod modification protein FlgD
MYEFRFSKKLSGGTMTHQIAAANYTMPSVLNTYKPIAGSAATTRATASTGAATTTSGTSSSDPSGVGATFLSLLTQELQNQDPTAPMDSTAMVGQMISLNQLEELTSINQAVGGSTTSTSGAAQPAVGATNSTVVSPMSVPQLLTSTAVAMNQLPFDPNTMMPATSGTTNAAALAASITSPLNAASMGFPGYSNNISGGK